MKIRYAYKLKGSLRADETFPIEVNGQELSFVLEKERIVGIAITRSIPSSLIPEVITEANQISEVRIPDVGAGNLAKSLRLAEGLLSLFGLEGIELNVTDITWVPENSEEEQSLAVSAFSHRLEAPLSEEPVPFHLIARPVISALLRNASEVPLSFFRRGSVEMHQGGYIQAIYNFYFVLETLFGNGKTKNAAIEKEFLSSRELVSAIEDARNDRDFVNELEADDRRAFENSFARMGAEDIIRRIVGTRGFLHHHSRKDQRSWNPDNQESYTLDARFLMQIAFKAVWGIFTKYVFDENVIKVFMDHHKKYHSSSAGGESGGTQSGDTLLNSRPK
jgi:hypothetical protein